MKLKFQSSFCYSFIVLFILSMFFIGCEKDEGVQPIAIKQQSIPEEQPFSIQDVKPDENAEAISKMESFMGRYLAANLGDDDKAKIPVKLFGYKKEKSRKFRIDSLDEDVYSFLALTDNLNSDKLYNIVIAKRKGDKWGKPQLMEYVINGYNQFGYPNLLKYTHYKLTGQDAKVEPRNCEGVVCTSGNFEGVNSTGGSGGTGGGGTGGGGGGTSGGGTGGSSSGGGPAGTSNGSGTNCTWRVGVISGELYIDCTGGLLFPPRYVFTGDCCENLYGTGIVGSYRTPNQVQSYLADNNQMKTAYMNLNLKYPNNDEVKMAMDEQILRMDNDPVYEQFVMSSFSWSPALWAIVREIAGDAAIDIIGNYLGVGSVKDAIKALKNSDWASFVVETGQVIWKNTPISKILKLGEAASDGTAAFNKIQNLADKLKFWSRGQLDRAYSIIQRAPKGLITNADYWKYVDDLADPKFGSYFAHAGNFNAKFREKWGITTGEIWVHHAVEKDVVNKFPSLANQLSQDMIHSLENLRGIPIPLNNQMHLSEIRLIWNRFYDNYSVSNPPSIQALLAKAKEIDNLYGSQFIPPMR
jgi:hypothetical protein